MQQPADACRALLQLVEAAAWAREVDPEGLVLDLRPAGAEADRCASTGQQVDRGHRLGQYGGMAEADGVDERPALHP